MTDKRVAALAMLCVIVVAATGCATILSGTNQTIAINSNPAGAHVRIGHQTGITPVTFEVPRGKDYPIEISQGADMRVVALHRNIEPMTLLNIIPPFWPGFIVDAVTGAITKYDPNAVMVDFTAPPSTGSYLTGYNR